MRKCASCLRARQEETPDHEHSHAEPRGGQPQLRRQHLHVVHAPHQPWRQPDDPALFRGHPVSMLPPQKLGQFPYDPSGKLFPEALIKRPGTGRPVPPMGQRQQIGQKRSQLQRRDFGRARDGQQRRIPPLPSAPAPEAPQRRSHRSTDFAQFQLGASYARGKAVTQDYTEAAKWFKKAADQGNADAQCALCLLYSLGKGVTQDNAEAAKWCRKAAEQGNADAQFFLGASYDKGGGADRIMQKQ